MRARRTDSLSYRGGVSALLPHPVNSPPSKGLRTLGDKTSAVSSRYLPRWAHKWVFGNVRLLTRQRSFVHLVRLGLALLVLLLGFRWKIRHDSAFKQTVEDFVDYYKIEYGNHPYDRIDLSARQASRIYAYEIAAGRYPSSRLPPQSIQEQLNHLSLTNPSLPSTDPTLSSTIPNSGSSRSYLPAFRPPRYDGTAPRPPQNGIIDLAQILELCAFENHRYVSDCLTVLSSSAGIRVNDTITPHSTLPSIPSSINLQHLYTLANPAQQKPRYDSQKTGLIDVLDRVLSADAASSSVLATPLAFTMPQAYRSILPTSSACDHDQNPRIFHVFWTGPFTDKPYAQALSFLYTQNLGLNYPASATDFPFCRPQLWFWLVPGTAASSVRPHPRAKERMMRDLRNNVWAAPLLHPRFNDLIKFHMWNTTEQLEAIPELRGQWQKLPLFKSGAYVLADVQYGDVVEDTAEIGVDQDVDEEEKEEIEADPILGRVASSSSNTYDKLAVVLSDMARFVLGHRFGGIYLDADTLLLRDFEELWNYPGAFAYRWSRMQQFNTAISKLNRGSALGSFIIKTALLNHLDFHPHSVWRFLKREGLLELYLRLPDALFDPAWLNTEYFQRDRPPHPYFESFNEFFEPPRDSKTVPAIEDFFAGAFTYHYHNQMWTAFDEEQNWPNIPTAPKDPLRLTQIRNARAIPKALSWGTTVKRSFESFLRGERTNMYGESINWEGLDNVAA